jgi:hypothetical protein
VQRRKTPDAEERVLVAAVKEERKGREREIEREKSGKTREKGRDNKRVAFSLGLEGGDFLLVVSSGRRCGGHRREEPGCFRPQPRALQVKEER